MEIREIKDKIEKAIIAVATVDSENKPHVIAVMYVKIKDDKIVITNNYMSSTLKNLNNNPNVSLVFWEKEKGWRIDGRAEYFNSGEWLDFVKGLPENKGESANGALVIDIENIKELG